MFKRLLVAIDLEYPDVAERTLSTALHIGGADAHYLLMSVIPPLGGSIIASYLPKNYDKRLMQDMDEKLRLFVRERFGDSGADFHYVVAHGPVYEEINLVAKQQHVDLVVVSATKPGNHGLGPNAARVARYGENSVLIIR